MRSRLRRMGTPFTRVFAVMAIMAGVLLGTAGVAAAHHADITGNVACDGTVTYTASSWQGSTESSMTNSQIKVWYVKAGESTKNTVTTGAFNKANGYQFGGTFAYPAGASSITLYAQAQVNWGDGAGPGDAHSIQLKPPTDCPGKPNVTSKVECTATGGKITITLKNEATSGNDVTFVVTPPAGQGGAQTVKVGPGASKDLVFKDLADGSYTYKVTADGKAQPDVVLSVVCNGVPKVTSKVECSAQGGTVTLTLANTAAPGHKAVTFVVTPPNGQGAPQTITVDPGKSQDVVFSNLADGTYTYKITADGKALDDVTLTVACNGTPKVTSKLECSAQGGTVTLTLANTASADKKPVTFVVTPPAGQGGAQTVSVDPGKSKDLIFTGLPDGQATFKITADGKALDDVVLTVSCNGVPKVEATSECSTTGGVVTITLSNTAPAGNKSVTFTVTDPVTKTSADYTVAAGDSKVLTFNDVPNGTWTYGITAGGKSFDQSFTIDCSGTGKAEIKAECSNFDGVVTITLTNTGEPGKVLPVQFVLKQGSTTVYSGAVQAGTPKVVTLTGVADGSYTYTVTADGKALPDLTVNVKCDGPGTPAVSHKVECSAGDGTVTLTLANQGQPGKARSVRFVVEDPRNGDQVVFDSSVAPGGSQPFTFQGTFPDGPVTVPVTAYLGGEDGTVGLSQTFTVDCDLPGVPAASSKVTCTALGGDVTVTLANEGLPGKNHDVVFTVTDPRGGAPVVVTVAPGQSKDVVLKGFPDGPATIGVSADTGGSAPDSLSSAAAPVNLDQKVVVKCEQPQVLGFTLECASGGIAVGLSNEGGSPTTLTVVKGTKVVQTVTVAAGGTTKVLVPMTEGETATVTVLRGDQVVGTETLTFNCTTPTTPTTTPPSSAEVQGIAVTPSGALPYTGGEAVRMVVIGLAVMMAGAGLVVVARRRA